MPLSSDLFNGVPERYGRFERFFLAQNTLGDQVDIRRFMLCSGTQL